MRRLSKMIINIVLIVITLTACQSSGIFPELSNNQNIISQSREKINIRFGWWGSEVRNKGILNALDLFMKEHPDIKLIGEYYDWSSYYQKLVTQLSGGTAPDIMAIDQSWLNDLSAQGYMFEDLYQYKNKLDFEKLNTMLLRDFTEENNHLFGIPFGLNAPAIVYNKQLVDKTGVVINTNSHWDWNTLLNEGTKFKKKYNDLTFLNTDIFSLENFVFRPYIIQKTGERWVKEDYTIGFDKESLIEAFKYIKSLIDNKIIESIGETIHFI